MGDSFSQDSYSGIRYNDPLFAVQWPCKPLIMSDKDINLPDFIDE